MGRTVDLENTQVGFAAKTDAELNLAYITYKLMEKPALNRVVPPVLSLLGPAKKPVLAAIKSTAFKVFCGGESIDECTRSIERYKAYGVGTILDYSVEGGDDEETFQQVYEELLRSISFAAGRSHVPFCVFKPSGIGRTHVLTKIQSNEQLTQDEQQAFERFQARFTSLCDLAGAKKVRLLVDAEESWFQDPVDRLTTAMMARHNRGQAYIYNTVQMYRHDRLKAVRAMLSAAKSGGYMLGLKIVRGAYLEKESDRARRLGYQSPMQPDKRACDTDYEAATELGLTNLDQVALCLGTHNEHSTMQAVAMIERLGIAPEDDRVYFAQLMGMSDNLTFNLAQSGFNTAKYMPYGPIDKVLPYLMRRAQENSSVGGMTSRQLDLITRERNRRAAG